MGRSPAFMSEVPILAVYICKPSTAQHNTGDLSSPLKKPRAAGLWTGAEYLRERPKHTNALLEGTLEAVPHTQKQNGPVDSEWTVEG